VAAFYRGRNRELLYPGNSDPEKSYEIDNVMENV